MKTIRIMVLLFLGLIAMLTIAYLFFYRDLHTEMYSGTYASKDVKVEEILHRSLIMNYSSYEIRIDNAPVLKIDAHTTERSVPYSDDVFGKANRFYLDTTLKYQNAIIYDDTSKATMLYLDKKTFSAADFKLFSDFFKTDWQIIVKEMHNNKYDIDTQIIGIIHGAKADFKQTFTGMQDGVQFDLDIAPNGEITFHETKGSLGFSGSGFANKVQMPGKILSFMPNSVFSADKYKTFKDVKGKTVFDYFKVENAKEWSGI